MSWTDAGRRKAAAARRGRHLSKSTRDKIARALRGKPHRHKGHQQSASTRAKISAALKGRRNRHHKGHAISPATRAKISAALKGRHNLRRKLGNYQSSRRLKPRFRFRVRTDMPLSVTNTSILNTKLRRNIHGASHMTNTGILGMKVRRGVLGGGKVSNKWVVRHHVPRRRRTKRSRLAK